MTRTVGRALVSLIIPLVLLGVWFYLHELKGEISFIADPRMVGAKAWTIRGDLAANSLLSLRRLLLGVLTGTAFGTLTGITLGRSRGARMLLGPTLNVLMAIPIIVFIPFFLMAFGFGELFRSAIVAALVFFLVHQAMFSVVRAFPTDWLELARISHRGVGGRPPFVAQT